ncbi:dsRBD fold-containing protein [Streptomyces sp. NPDC021100]|uniref:dsRBD fold-containing protein n=1 Tax=Streptomyces sp. NPDC021100 TaxID=3365114 RepID=UPI0037883B47
MQHVAGWHVEVEFDEDDRHVRAAALLRLRDGTEVRARGKAARHPADPGEARVGEELAGARALVDLAEQLAAKGGHEAADLRAETAAG